MQVPELLFARMTRRSVLRGGVTAPLALLMSACAVQPAGGTQGQTLSPTPACGDGDDLTPSETEGPYFKPSSPQRTSLLEPGLQGTRLVVTGMILTRGCYPVANALLDFWQADAQGRYDNTGFRLRGHQFSDSHGAYRLETIVPGLYPGRTRHIHVKVQAPGQPILTTQLYFPGESRNASDSIFNPVLLLTNVHEVSRGKAASFDFILSLA